MRAKEENAPALRGVAEVGQLIHELAEVLGLGPCLPGVTDGGPEETPKQVAERVAAKLHPILNVLDEEAADGLPDTFEKLTALCHLPDRSNLLYAALDQGEKYPQPETLAQFLLAPARRFHDNSSLGYPKIAYLMGDYREEWRRVKVPQWQDLLMVASQEALERDSARRHEWWFGLAEEDKKTQVLQVFRKLLRTDGFSGLIRPPSAPRAHPEDVALLLGVPNAVPDIRLLMGVLEADGELLDRNKEGFMARSELKDAPGTASPTALVVEASKQRKEPRDEDLDAVRAVRYLEENREATQKKLAEHLRMSARNFRRYPKLVTAWCQHKDSARERKRELQRRLRGH
jgi:hypothetical protein